jgi:hypothetical protein
MAAKFLNNIKLGSGLSTNVQLQITPTSNQLVLGSTNTTTISATAPGISRVYTIPDAGADSEIILSNAGIVSQQATLAPVSPNSSTFVGVANSITENYCAISSHTTGTGGQVIIFVRDGSTWSLQQTIAASDAFGNAQFGIAISISSTGMYLIVGANQANSGGTLRGQAYIFIRSGTTWTEQQILTAAGDAVNSAKFGDDVSISSDGNYAIVGAPNHTSGGTARGKAYVFIRSGTTWTQQQILTASDQSSNAHFGNSISISSDGTYAIVAASSASSGGSSRGQAYIFIRSGATWTEQQILQASDESDNAFFGFSVSIDSTGTYVVIGAPDVASGGSSRGQVYIFIRSGASWTEQQILQASDEADGANFGRSVAIYGTRVLVTAPHANGAGSDRGQAYIFNRSGATWTQQKILVPSDAQTGALFGGSSGKSASMCESYASVGSQNYDITPFTDSGKVYVFSGKQTLGSGVLSSGIIETSMCRISSPITTQNIYAPAISHTINANTGIYFPLDNTLGISANGVASTVFSVNGFGSTVQPFLYLRRTTTQSIANNTQVVCEWDVTPIQQQGSTITNTSGVISFSVAGTYMFCGKVLFAANGVTAGGRFLFFTHSALANTRLGLQTVPSVDSNTDFSLSTTACAKVTTSDTVTLSVLQFSGSSLNISSSTFTDTKNSQNSQNRLYNTILQRN